MKISTRDLATVLSPSGLNILDISRNVQARRAIVYSAVAVAAAAVLLGLNLLTALMSGEINLGEDSPRIIFSVGVVIAFLPAIVLFPVAIAATRGVKWGVATIVAVVATVLVVAPVIVLVAFPKSVLFLIFALVVLLLLGLRRYASLMLMYLKLGDRNLLFPYQRSSSRPATHFRAWHNFKTAPPNKRVKALAWMLIALPIGVITYRILSFLLFVLAYLLEGSADLRQDTINSLVSVAVISAIAVAWFIVRYGLRHIAPSAAAVRHEDQRPPILLLRSFKDENIATYRFGSIFAQFGGVLLNWLLLRKRLDEFLEETLYSYGPVIAIGRPKEALPSLGAAREYASDDHWMSLVETRIREAQLVIAILGSTEGFAWEMSAIPRMSARQKLILVVPPMLKANKKSELWKTISKSLDVGFDLPADSIIVSWDDDSMTVLTADRKYQQAVAYRIALAWVLYAKGASAKGTSAQPARRTAPVQLPVQPRVTTV